MCSFKEWGKRPGILALIFLILVLGIVIGYNLWPIRNAKVEITQENASKRSHLLSASEKKSIEKPDFETIPDSPYGESIHRGKTYLEKTYEQLPKYVGAKINCTSCHLDSGTRAFAGPWVGIVTRFPQYRSRSAKMDTLVDRVNDCFERSLNGKRLPEGSREMTDILSYMTWLSTGYSIGQSIEGSGMPKLALKREPDLAKGKIVYQVKCLSCHQSNGQGLYTEQGQAIFPALWGPKSFNIGAGMARLHTAAGFVKHNMPQGQEGSLTDDEAWDVAAYFSQQERPDFKKKKMDWSKGEKPEDARY